VHFGTPDAIDQERQNTLTAAYHAHPERFGRRPHPPAMSTQSWIDQPELEPQNELTATVSADLTDIPS